MMTQEDFLKIADSLKNAEKDDTPFAVIKDDEIAVVGDANKTHVKRNEYVVSFRFPLSNEIYKTPESKVIGDFYITNIAYKDVMITPRKDLTIVGAIMKLIPYFKNLVETGEVIDKTEEELFDVFLNLKTDILDAMYNVVSTMLEIDDRIVDNMMPTSVFKVCAQLIEDYPEVFNEADLFFE